MGQIGPVLHEGWASKIKKFRNNKLKTLYTYVDSIRFSVLRDEGYESLKGDLCFRSFKNAIFFFYFINCTEKSQKYIPKVLTRNSKFYRCYAQLRWRLSAFPPFSFQNFKRGFLTKFFLICVHSNSKNNWPIIFEIGVRLHNYAEHELTVEVLALFKVPFFNAKSCKHGEKWPF